MEHSIEAIIFVAYSFLASIVTAGGGMLVTNALNLTGVDLIKATGLTSSFFLANAVIAVITFRKDIVWKEVRRILPVAVLGSFIGSTVLVNIMSPIVLLSLMFLFSLNFIYKKVKSVGSGAVASDPFVKDSLTGLFAGAVTGMALPGGGFLNSYFASKGLVLSQMFATISITIIFVYVAKVSVMLNSGVLVPSDLTGVAIAFPFLIVSNILVRKGLTKLSKAMTDKITIFSMVLFSIYALATVLLEVI
jgi:uncharacterized membrane protein YfcA